MHVKYHEFYLIIFHVHICTLSSILLNLGADWFTTASDCSSTASDCSTTVSDCSTAASDCSTAASNFMAVNAANSFVPILSTCPT